MNYEGTLLDSLIGKTISHICRIRDDVLAIIHNDGVLYCYAEADCCSETWFSDFFMPTPIYGKVVTSIEIEDDRPEIKNYNLADHRVRQDSDELYHFVIKTENGGDVVICYRNSSNGYYGGWLEFSNEFDMKRYSIPAWVKQEFF
jgi:hypothetical protein